jgi:glutamine cyclotransferase
MVTGIAYALLSLCMTSVIWIAAPAVLSGVVSDEVASDSAPVHYYEVVNSWPHDPAAYTQGLVFHNGLLYESTGKQGFSSLRMVDLQTGKVIRKIDLPQKYFAEGITVLGRKIFQLTWLHQKGFIYDKDTLRLTGEFRYEGEGWGLTDDGRLLIMSDGTNTLRFLNPGTFQIERTLKVLEDGRPVTNLNELEYIKGEIYANIWQSDKIVRIDPETGRVKGWINLAGLVPVDSHGQKEAVLNGIAYDKAGDRLFVTGKLWPKLFEIRVR